MTQDLGQQLREDRMLRNSAHALFKADLANLRGDLAAKSVGDRIVDRIHEGAVDIFEEAVELADSNRGIAAGLAGAVVLWFARDPIMSLLTDDEAPADYDDQEHEGAEPA